MQEDEKMENATAKKLLAALTELERELTTAREKACKGGSAQVSSNDSYQFLLGVGIGLDRALKIVQGKLAPLRPDAASLTKRSPE